MTSWSPSGIIFAYLTSLSQDVDARLAKGNFNQTHCRIAPPALVSFHNRNIVPDDFYRPNVFVWLPQVLRASLRIQCPKCNGIAITERGWIFRRIVDVNASCFVLAKEYACNSCVEAASESAVFSTCDSNVLREFPSDIQSAFPAIMVPGTDGGLSRTIVNFIQACSKSNLTLEVAHSIVVDMHMARYIERKAAFEASAAQAIQSDVPDSSSDDGSLMISEPKFFSTFDDIKGYGGFIPPAAYLRPFFDGINGVRPDAALWAGSVVIAATEIMTVPIVPAISIEKKPPTMSNHTSPDTGSSEPKRKRRPRRCQNRIMVNGEVVICGLMDCPGRGGQKFCKNFSGARYPSNEIGGEVSVSQDPEDLSKLSTLATLVRPTRDAGLPVRESELVAMEALQNMI